MHSEENICIIRDGVLSNLSTMVHRGNKVLQQSSVRCSTVLPIKILQKKRGMQRIEVQRRPVPYRADHWAVIEQAVDGTVDEYGWWS